MKKQWYNQMYIEKIRQEWILLTIAHKTNKYNPKKEVNGERTSEKCVVCKVSKLYLKKRAFTLSTYKKDAFIPIVLHSFSWTE